MALHARMLSSVAARGLPSFGQTLLERFYVGSSSDEVDERGHASFRDCPQGQAGNQPIELLGRLDLDNEAKRNAASDRTSGDDATFTSQLLGLGESRKDHVRDKRSGRVRGEWLARFRVIDFDEEFHGDIGFEASAWN